MRKTKSHDRSRGKLTESFRKCSILLVAAILILSAAMHFQPVTFAASNAGNYIVTEGSNLAMITPSGVRTVIYNYASYSPALGVAIDSAGNYIVTESYRQPPYPEWEYNALSKITPSGVRTIIFQGAYYGLDDVAVDSAGNYIVAAELTPTFGADIAKITPSGVYTAIYDYAPGGPVPNGVAIDSAGNYIVAEFQYYADKLVKITPSGVRTIIYDYGSSTWPNLWDVAIDSAGNYIVVEMAANKLSKVTPSGVRTVIYSFAAGTSPRSVAVDTAGNYIVTEWGKLSKITPSGVRTVIYDYGSTANPWDVAIVPGAVDPSTFDEYFDGLWYTPFDSDGDGYNDAIEVEMEADTTYSGTLGVEAGAYLKNPSGTTVDTDFPSWSITDGATEYGYANVYVPAGSPQGWYNVSLGLWDEWGNYEDYRIDVFWAYLYPPSTKTNTVLDFGFIPNPVAPGAMVTLSGTLKTAGGSPVYPAQVKVEYSTNGGATWNFFTNLNTNAAGQFSTSFGAPGVGTYLVRVSYAGSTTYNPSSDTETLTVQTTTGWGDYHFRISPWTDVLHLKISGNVIYGIDDYDDPTWGYHNQPVLGYIEGGSFYLFIDFTKYDNGDPITAFELGMLVGSMSTLSGNYWNTWNGALWEGPMAFSLVSVSSTSTTTGSALASAVEPESWPATYHFKINPWVDELYLSLDGKLVHGVCEAAGIYSDQPVLGYLGGKLIFAIDYQKDVPGMIYDLCVCAVSISTMSGNAYRTVDGKSVVGPTTITLTSLP